MYNFFKNLFFRNKFLTNKKQEKKSQKNLLNNPLKLSRPLYGYVEAMDFDFDREILKQNSDFQEMAVFQKVNQIILSNISSKEISKIIVDEIRKKLKYTLGVLFIIDWDTGREWPFITSSDLSDNLEALFGKKLSEHIGIIAEQDNLVVKSALNNKIYIADDARDIASPVLSANKAFLMQKILRMKKLILIPLIVKGKTIGALVVASNRNNVEIKERLMVKLLADQVAIALYNAKLYEETQNQVQALKEKTLDLKSLLDVSEIAASSLDARSITQKIVDSIPEKFGHLGYLGGILTMYDSKTNRISTYSITESELVQKKIKKILDKPFKNYYTSAVANKTLTIDAIKTGKMQLGDKVCSFVSPPVGKNIARVLQKVAGIKACAAMPIFVHGKVIGACIFAMKKPLKEISSRDTEIMMAIVNHIGVSIDNAMLFDETKRQVKELEYAKAKLEQTLNMKAEFVHVVSHQLRTPLTVVRGLISMWYDGDFEKLPEGKRKDFRERIKSSIERLNSITNQMLRAMEFEGSITLNSEDVDLIKTVRDIIALLKPNFESKGLYLNFENKTGKNKLLIEADPNYISHVFNNLIDNAEKYTFKGGVDVIIGSRGNYVCVKIQDTGIGITKENKARLFKKFSRGVNALKDNPNGSGLGLFIAKQIVSEHKGKISFESKGLGKGTMFTVTLPVRQAKG